MFWVEGGYKGSWGWIVWVDWEIREVDYVWYFYILIWEKKDWGKS